MNTREDILAELERTDHRTRALLEDLSADQLAVPYERGINPPIWELGHAAFFYEVFILRALDGEAPRMPGYDAIWDSFEIRHEDRWQPGVVPGKESTMAYYSRMIDTVRDRLAHTALDDQARYLYTYAIYHQNMHIESLIWSRQSLGYKAPVFAAAPETTTPPTVTGDAAIPGGRYVMGVDSASGAFGFDNEKPGFEMEIAPFAISRTLVSNREFQAFVEEGGYANDEAWSYGGRQWRNRSNAAHPRYWRHRDGAWQLRHFDQWMPLPPDAPVMHVSFWEAEAFATWAGRRLPSEFEWEAAARGPAGRLMPWGDDMDADKVDMNGTLINRRSVHDWANGATPEGVQQMLGTCWEWTSSQFLPYDGFKVDMYPYMSTLQFGDHKVARGGSCATSSCLIRNSYRQAYVPDRRDVFVGFRTCAG